MGFTGVKITSDKEIEVLGDVDYNAMSDAVEGLIECVHLPLINADLWVNDSFLLLHGADRFNSIATDLCGLGGRPDLMLSGILGNVLVSGPVDQGGDTTDITPVALKAIRRIAGEA